MNQRRAVLLFVVVLVALASVFFFFSRTTKNPAPATVSREKNLGTQVGEAVDPLEQKLPETNPFAAPTNPVKIVYPNPFDHK